MDWTSVTDMFSSGHDIESSWLLLEAADVLGDPVLRSKVSDAAVALARVTMEDSFDTGGGLVNEARPGGVVDSDKYWWAQFEALVGFFNAYQETRSEDFLEAASETWEFARRFLADENSGEWFFRVSQDGRPYPEDDIVGMWKCPYHGSRACFEVMERINRLE